MAQETIAFSDLAGNWPSPNNPGGTLAGNVTKLNSNFTELYAGAGALSTSPSQGVGYATGAGGAVTQATNKSTGVTLNNVCGAITMNNASLAAGAEVAFTLTNSRIAATDVVVACVKSGGTSAAYSVGVTAVAAGSCEITVSNLTAGSLGEALVLNFVVVKAVAA
jgi:X-X-X-Leu-X-X-Gly heptad repeat protein